MINLCSRRCAAINRRLSADSEYILVRQLESIWPNLNDHESSPPAADQRQGCIVGKAPVSFPDDHQPALEECRVVHEAVLRFERFQTALWRSVFHGLRG